MNQEEFGKRVKLHAIEHHGSAKNYAKHLGVSQGYISSVCRGATPPNNKILKELGFEKLKTVSYIKSKG